MIAKLLFELPMTVAVGSWFFTAFNLILAMQHRKPEVPLSKLLLSGLASLDAANYTVAGALQPQ